MSTSEHDHDHLAKRNQINSVQYRRDSRTMSLLSLLKLALRLEVLYLKMSAEARNDSQ